MRYYSSLLSKWSRLHNVETNVVTYPVLAGICLCYGVKSIRHLTRSEYKITFPPSLPFFIFAKPSFVSLPSYFAFYLRYPVFFIFYYCVSEFCDGLLSLHFDSFRSLWNCYAEYIWISFIIKFLSLPPASPVFASGFKYLTHFMVLNNLSFFFTPGNKVELVRRGF
jgi:hypothetical protein